MDLKTLEETPKRDWPVDAHEIILKVLRDPKAKETERMIAAKLAGEHEAFDETLAARLLEIFQDDRESDELRSAAAMSLGPALEYFDIVGFDDFEDIMSSKNKCDKFQKALRKIYMDADASELIRRRALEASAHAPRYWHQIATRVAYQGRDEDWKLTAVVCMEHVSGFEKQIVDALCSDNPDIRCHAVRAAGAWEVECAWNHVSSIVRSKTKNKALLLAAIEAAASICPEEAEDLLSPLRQSPDGEIAGAVEKAEKFMSILRQSPLSGAVDAIDEALAELDDVFDIDLFDEDDIFF